MRNPRIDTLNYAIAHRRRHASGVRRDAEIYFNTRFTIWHHRVGRGGDVNLDSTLNTLPQ